MESNEQGGVESGRVAQLHHVTTDDGMHALIEGAFTPDAALVATPVTEQDLRDIIDDPADAQLRPVVLADITRLERAQALPELRGDANLDPVLFAPGSIQRFKSEDRRTMEIIAIGGALACREVSHG